MAIALPAPQVPQLGSVKEISRHESGKLTVSYHGYQLHIFGNTRIPEQRLVAAIKKTSNLSDAIRTIGILYYRAGYPAARVMYAPSGTTIYISIEIGHIKKVSVDEPFRPYYDGLTRATPLTDAALVPGNILASVLADRAGLDLHPIIKSDEAQGDIFKLVSDGGAPGTVKGGFDYGNIGNRYVGRDIADARMSTSTPYGDELSFGVISSVHGWGIGDSGGFYRELNGGYSRVTPFGIFSIGGRFAPFRQTYQGVQFQEAIQQVTVSWLTPLYADFYHRLTGQFEAQRTSLAANVVGQRQDVLSELYTSIQGGFKYQQMLSANGHWQFGSDALVGYGLGPHASPLTNANLDYLVVRPGIRISYIPSVSWTTTIAAQAQITSDTLPEQEQWVLGGMGRLSGYRAGVLIGDSGLLTSLNLQRKGLKLFSLSFSPGAFVEYGFSRQSYPQPGQSRAGTQALGDAGFMLDIASGKAFLATASIAEGFYSHNIDPASKHTHEATYFFRVSLAF